MKKDKDENTAEVAPAQDVDLELADVIAPSAIKINPKSVNLSGKMARTLFVISYPRYLTEGWFEPIVNLAQTFDVALHIHPVDTAEVLKKFQNKVLK